MNESAEFESLEIEWRNDLDGFCEVDFKVWLMRQVVSLRKKSRNGKTGAIDELLKELNEHYNDPIGMISSARAELAQLRADLKAARERIAWLTSDIGESGLAAINCLIAACERGDIAQQAAPDLSIARDEILRQARQLDAARDVMSALHDYEKEFDICPVCNHAPNDCECGYSGIRAWLAANPAPEAEQQTDDERIDRMLDASGWESDEIAEV